MDDVRAAHDATYGRMKRRIAELESLPRGTADVARGEGSATRREAATAPPAQRDIGEGRPGGDEIRSERPA